MKAKAVVVQGTPLPGFPCLSYSRRVLRSAWTRKLNGSQPDAKRGPA